MVTLIYERKLFDFVKLVLDFNNRCTMLVYVHLNSNSVHSSILQLLIRLHCRYATNYLDKIIATKCRVHIVEQLNLNYDIISRFLYTICGLSLFRPDS